MSFRRMLLGSLGLLALGYAAFVFAGGSPYAGGADSSGYLNSARLLAQGRLLAVPRTEIQPPALDPSCYVPLGFRPSAGGRSFAPTYPVGLPLHLLLAHWLVGWSHAATLVNAFVALGAAFLLVLAADEIGLPSSWGVAGALCLWACPLFITYLLQPMSDALALLWCLLAVWSAWKARHGWGWAVLSGFAVAVAVLIRPTNLLIVLPVLLALPPRLRTWTGLVLGGLPGAIFLGFYNRELYGAVLTTGYGDIRSILAWRYAPYNSRHFLLWLPLLLTPVLTLPVLALPFQPRGCRRTALVLGTWIIAFAGFYVFYEPAGETWWYLRFLLPAFPAVILAGLLGLHRAYVCWHRRQPRIASVTALTVLLVMLSFEIGLGRHLNITRVRQSESTYRLSAAWIEQKTPPDAIVVCMQTSGALFFYTDRAIVRWDYLDAPRFDQLVRACEAGHHPLFACLFDFEIPSMLAHTRKTGWQQRARIGAATLWELTPPGR